MWKTEHRRVADRRGLRYSSDLIDAEWALLEPTIPPAKRGGRPRDVNVREVLNAIFYVLSTGCQWHRGSYLSALNHASHAPPAERHAPQMTRGDVQMPISLGGPPYPSDHMALTSNQTRKANHASVKAPPSAIEVHREQVLPASGRSRLKLRHPALPMAGFEVIGPR
jgi:Putative transposase of IS4/5 family (DUF4096)